MQAFGTAVDFQNWYSARVIGIRQNDHGVREVLVDFGQDSAANARHTEWIPTGELCYERMRNRFSLFSLMQTHVF